MFPLAITFILFFKTNKVLVMGLALLVLLPSSLYVFGRRIDEVKNNNVWYYLPQTIKQGFDFLEKSEGDGVLAMPPLASYIPAYAGKHVYLGHKDQTPSYYDRMSKAEGFYAGKLTEDEAKKFLQENKINYVVGKVTYSFLTTIYRSEGIEILKFGQ
jgi:hypothetical protein